MLNQSLTASINHLLAAEVWARDKLRPHAGKAAVIRVKPVIFSFVIEESGLIATGSPDQEAALDVTLAPLSLLGALRGDESALKDADIHGDAEFANAVLYLVKNLRWDVEDDLSGMIGDIAAHRMVADARAFLAWGRDARGRIAGSFAEFLTQEAGILAPDVLVDDFVAGVDRLRDDTARLEKRFALLAKSRRD